MIRFVARQLSKLEEGRRYPTMILHAESIKSFVRGSFRTTQAIANRRMQYWDVTLVSAAVLSRSEIVYRGIMISS